VNEGPARCWICDRTNWIDLELPHGVLCRGCRGRVHYHPRTCPVCQQRRPLAFLDDGLVVCAGCAGINSPFACRTCGSEGHPYGGSRCARCILAERLTTLLTDPSTGQIHTRLQPVFDELVGSERPQTGIWWLLKKKGAGTGPRLLGQMARGETAISHGTFQTLPSDRAHDYLRTLLATLGVLEPWEPHIERMTPWLDALLAPVAAPHVDVVRQFARWHIIRHMRHSAATKGLSQAGANAARARIKVALEFLTMLGEYDATVATATQDHLERFMVTANGRAPGIASFVAWLRNSRINTGLTTPWIDRGMPPVTVSDEQRWEQVERLLHDHTLRTYTRIGGLFTLLFAQPLTRIVAMRTDQVTADPDGNVLVAFTGIAIPMPPIVDEIIRTHLLQRGKSLYRSRDTGWLFPGGIPGQHLATENIRAGLVEIGIKPYESRKAALFQLAAEMPAPILAELIGITDSSANDWARLAARPWSSYIATRPGLQ